MPPPATLSTTTPTALPPPKEVPWWGALILAVLTAIVSVVGTIYYILGKKSAATGGPPGISALLTDSITFLPHILILFGVFADIFTLQGAYSIPSLVGILSVPLNFAMQYFWSGVAGLIAGAISLITTKPEVEVGPQAGGAMSAWSGCEIEGFGSLVSPYAPQSLVVTATIFWYYLLDLMLNRDPMDSILAWLAFIVFFGMEVFQLTTCDSMKGNVLIVTFISLVEGFIFGGTGYGIVQTYLPTRLPSGVLPQGPLLSSLTKNADGTYTDSKGVSYIVGPDGRPIPASFVAAAAVAAAPAVQPPCARTTTA